MQLSVLPRAIAVIILVIPYRRDVAENYGDARRLPGQRMMQSLHFARPSVRHLNLVYSLNFIQLGELKLY